MSHLHTTTPKTILPTHRMSSSNLDFKSCLFKELCLKGLQTKHLNYNWDKLLKFSWFSWRRHSETGNREVTTEVSLHQVDRMRKGILGSGGKIANKRNTSMHQGTINHPFGWKLRSWTLTYQRRGWEVWRAEVIEPMTARPVFVH